MNWLVGVLQKEAAGRRYQPNDSVRYFTDGRKGKGRGIVLTPNFSKGTIVDFNKENRRYKVRNNKGEEMDIHPRNIVPDSFHRSPVENKPLSEPTIEEPIIQEPVMVEPFSR